MVEKIKAVQPSDYFLAGDLDRLARGEEIG
jgi:hypothetical protein